MAKGFTVKANTPSTKKVKKEEWDIAAIKERMKGKTCLLYTSPSPRDGLLSRMPSSA